MDTNTEQIILWVSLRRHPSFMWFLIIMIVRYWQKNNWGFGLVIESALSKYFPLHCIADEENRTSCSSSEMIITGTDIIAWQVQKTLYTCLLLRSSMIPISHGDRPKEVIMLFRFNQTNDRPMLSIIPLAAYGSDQVWKILCCVIQSSFNHTVSLKGNPRFCTEGW